MKFITLTHGYETRVSDVDYEWLRQWKWMAHVSNSNGKVYARRTARPQVFMHRVITDAPPTLRVDHWDRDELNNQRPNLRLCSFNENNANRQGYGISGYKGVYLTGQNWRVQITCNGERIEVGRFPTKIAAAKAYDAKAVELFGEFAYLNFPEDYPPPNPDVEPIVIPF